MIRSDNFIRHQIGNQCRTVKCNVCDVIIPYIRKKQHKKDHERNHARIAVTQPNITLSDILPPFFIDFDYEDIYKTFQKAIESYVKDFQLAREINFQLESFTNDHIAEAFKTVYDHQTQSFKVSISIGCILQNKETDELVFYRASRNNQRLFDDTYLISCQNDFKCMHDRILAVDLQARISYPNTKFVYVKTTNVGFYLTKLLGNPIGSQVELPTYLKCNKGLISLVTSAAYKAGKSYSDNLCFFRALALFRGFNIRGLENETKRLLKTYCEKAMINPKEFKGIYLTDLEELSRTFGVAINVYFQKPNRDTELVFRTIRQDNILYLNLYHNHFSYISDFQKYSNRYRCTKCDKIFTHVGNFKVHIKGCDGATRKIYSSGVFRIPPTIFEKLDDRGIHVPVHDRVYRYRITFDAEAYLTTGDTPADTPKVKYSHRHHLASVSVCSNLPGYEEASCFVSDGDPKKLMKRVIEYMLRISNASATILSEYYSEYLDKLDPDDHLYEEFKLYLTQIPVLGFNNSKYDFKLMRDYLIPVLIELEDIKFVIKKGTQYTCILTKNLRFLDVLSYLAPGFDYQQFLLAYGASSTKGFFAYGWFSSLEKLNSKEFPSYDSFYSSLKTKNTLEPYENEALSEEEIALIGRTPNKENLLTSLEITQIAHYRYQKIKEMFVENNWSMREYLEYYNNLDTKPFIEALENLSRYYVDRGVDVFKDGVSGR